MNNTGNPVGSKAFPDFEDNVEILDVRLTSDEDTFQDRLGKSRLTWAGIVKAGTGDTSVAVNAAARAVDAAGRAENAEAIVDAANIKAEVDRAEGAADRAEAASDAAFVNADVYPDIATGRAAVAVGEQFQVLSSDGFEYIRYRKDSPAVSPEVGRIPAPGLIELNRHAINVVESEVGMPASFAIKSGASVRGSEGAPLAFGAGRAYIGWFDISGVASIEMSGAVSPSQLVWVFRDENMAYVGRSTEGNGILSVPEGARYTARTVRDDTIGLIEDFDTFRVKLVRENGVSGTLTDQVRELGGEVDVLARSLAYQLPNSVTEGAAVRIDIDGDSPLNPGPDRAYIGWIDVSEVATIVVSGARSDVSAWLWVFRDENMAYVDRSSSYGNGRFPVPAGAKYAARTVMASGLEETLSTMKILLEDKNPAIGTRVAELEESITDLSEAVDGLAGVVSKRAVSPNQFSGDTQHERIDNAIKFIKKRGHGILELGVDTVSQPNTSVWVADSALLLPSNCWLILRDATLKLADGVFDNIIRNDGIVPDPDPYKIAQELNENHNIKILGFGDSAIEGPDVPFAAPRPGDVDQTPVPWVGDDYGWRTICILFANVKGYEIAGFHMTDTTCWAISQESGCEDFEVHDLSFNTRVKNGDGVDVRMGCRNGKIYNISGHTLDDSVALTAIKNYETSWPSNNNNIFPLQVGGYSGEKFGSAIEDIEVWNIATSGSNNNTRLLASGGGKLRNITVDDIKGISGFANTVIIGTGFGTAAQMGDIDRIFINGVKSNSRLTAIRINGPIQNSCINFVRQGRLDGTIINDAGATYNNVEISNVEFGDS